MAKKTEYFKLNNLLIAAVIFIAILSFYGGTEGRNTLQVEDVCVNEGNFCSGTGEVWTCDQRSDGVYVASLLETCDDGYICDSKEGACELKNEVQEENIPDEEPVVGDDDKQGLIPGFPEKGSTKFYIYAIALSVILTGMIVYMFKKK